MNLTDLTLLFIYLYEEREFSSDRQQNMEKRHLIFIRHGQQHSVKEDSQAPNTAGLTSLGMKQADLTARRLEACGLTQIFFSPFHRSKDSARIIGNRFPQLPRHEVKHLQEVSPPYPASHAAANTDTAAGLRKQLDKLIQRFFHASRGQECREAFITHGNLIRCLICRVMNMPRDQWLRLELKHGSLTEFVVTKNSEILLHSMNDVGHIPQHLQSHEAG